MSVKITINVSGVNEVIRDYKKFRFDMSENMIIPLSESTNAYLKVIQTNFNNQGRTFGEPWPPLRPATLAEKKKLGYPSKILVRTGALKRGFGRKESKHDAYIYNTQRYAVTHQEGATVKFHGRSVAVPRRVLAEVDNERVNMVALIFTRWLNKIVAKNSL